MITIMERVCGSWLKLFKFLRNIIFSSKFRQERKGLILTATIELICIVLKSDKMRLYLCIYLKINTRIILFYV